MIGSKNLIPRGKRNGNPLNVKGLPHDPWRGQIGVDSGGHAIFSDEAFSIRAALRDIAGDILKDGLNTLEKLFAEYAPVDDASASNDPRAYARYVASACCVGVDDDLAKWFNADGTVLESNKIFHMLYAMACNEVGTQYVPDEPVFDYGMYMYDRDFKGR